MPRIWRATALATALVCACAPPPAIPPSDDVEVERAGRELVVVVDGTLGPASRAAAGHAVAALLADLGPDDGFQIVRGADGARLPGDGLIGAGDDAPARALDWLAAWPAGGPASMSDGLAAAIALPGERERVIVLIGDGWWRDAAALPPLIDAADARVFVLAVGPAPAMDVARALGPAQHLPDGDDALGASARFVRRVDATLAGESVEWDDAPIVPVTVAVAPARPRRPVNGIVVGDMSSGDYATQWVPKPSPPPPGPPDMGGGVELSYHPGPMGTIDKVMIRRPIRARLGRVQYCYDVARRRDPTLTGTITMHFAIKSDGSVPVLTVDGVGDDELHTCVKDAFADLSFAAFGDHALIRVSYPFQLGPEEE